MLHLLLYLAIMRTMNEDYGYAGEDF